MTCKGCYALGTACGKCERCAGEVHELFHRGEIAIATHRAAVEWGRRQRVVNACAVAPDALLDDVLRRQARLDPLLRRVVELMDQYPRDGASQCRVMRRALLELGKRALVMERVALELLGLSARPMDFGALCQRAADEMEEEKG